MMEVRRARIAKGVVPSMKRVDTCAAEFEAGTPYMYSAYDGECECESDDKKKVGWAGGNARPTGHQPSSRFEGMKHAATPLSPFDCYKHYKWRLP